MNKVKVGIIGLGSHAYKSHIQYLKNMPNVDVIGGHDLDEKKELKFKETFPEASFHSKRYELLESDIDAVFIMTPDSDHASAAYHSLLHKKHVFCEKPLISLEREISILIDLITIASNNKLVFTSCHPRRFDPPFLWVKNNLQSLIKEYGEVISFDFDFSYSTPPNKVIHSGLLIDHFNHEIDLMNYILGYSNFSVHKLNDSNSQYRAVGQRDDGVSFSFSGSRYLDKKVYPEFLSIRFHKGEIELNSMSGEIFEKEHSSSLTRVLNKNDIVKTDYETRFKMTNENFINSILGTDKNYLSMNDLKINSISGVWLSEHNYYCSQYFRYKNQ